MSTYVKAIRPNECVDAEKEFIETVNRIVGRINEKLNKEYMSGTRISLPYDAMGEGVIFSKVKKIFEASGWKVTRTYDQKDREGWISLEENK